MQKQHRQIRIGRRIRLESYRVLVVPDRVVEVAHHLICDAEHLKTAGKSRIELGRPSKRRERLVQVPGRHLDASLVEVRGPARSYVDGSFRSEGHTSEL